MCHAGVLHTEVRVPHIHRPLRENRYLVDNSESNVSLVHSNVQLVQITQVVMV